MHGSIEEVNKKGIMLSFKNMRFLGCFKKKTSMCAKVVHLHIKSLIRPGKNI